MSVLHALEGHIVLQLFVTGLLGLIVGSFLNVVAIRLPRRMEAEWRAQCAELTGNADNSAEIARFGLVWPPSRCPHCDHRLSPWENIPLVSYLALRGRCRACGTTISPRYPVTEAITAVLSMLVIWRLGWTTQAAAGLAFTWCLVALTAIDLEHLLLPDAITLPLLWLGLLLSLGGLFVSAGTAIIGAAAGYLSLWAVYHLFRLVTGKEGMGYGDFKLLGAIGAWLGWQSLPMVVILSSFVGAAVGIAMIVGLGRHRQQPIPFGPYLAAAGWIALLWGDSLLSLYLDAAGIT